MNQRNVVADRLRNIEEQLRSVNEKLSKRFQVTLEADIAFQKFATRGEGAVPMRTKEVAVVLGVSTKGVSQAVFEKRLVQKWPGGRFHPDDVRVYLEHCNESRTA